MSIVLGASSRLKTFEALGCGRRRLDRMALSQGTSDWISCLLVRETFCPSRPLNRMRKARAPPLSGGGGPPERRSIMGLFCVCNQLGSVTNHEITNNRQITSQRVRGMETEKKFSGSLERKFYRSSTSTESKQDYIHSI